jgi:hypothetical protein
MVELVEGQKYRLPNGEVVTAKLYDGNFILEFRRKYRYPLAVGKDGRLFLRGEGTSWTLDNLSPDEEEEMTPLN